MNEVVAVYKPIGMTPLEIIDAFRKEFPVYQNEKIGYAGRLDPLAHGILLLMVGGATKERDQYLDLEKTYEFEVLFGFETDTFDVLGLVTEHMVSKSQIVNEKVSLFVNDHVGSFVQTYPPYSSKTVKGKPLFWWARENRLHEITFPTRQIKIRKFEQLSYDDIDKNVLQQKIHDMIGNVRGDFRQNEISRRWDAVLRESISQTFHIAQFRITCTSGTYVRGLVQELGKTLGTGAIALDINRTKIGRYSLKDAQKLTYTR